MEVEEKIIGEIYQKGNDKDLKEKVSELEKLEENKVANKEKIEELKAEILKFKESKNIYKIVSYQKQELKIEQLLKKLETNPAQMKKELIFLRKETIIPLCLIIGIVMASAVMIGSSKIRKVRTKKKMKVRK